MTTEQQAGREELIAFVKDVKDHIAVGTSHIQHNRLLRTAMLILDREPPNLEPCGHCGNFMEYDRVNSTIRCHHFNCCSFVRHNETLEELISRANAANAAIRAMKEG